MRRSLKLRVAWKTLFLKRRFEISKASTAQEIVSKFVVYDEMFKDEDIVVFSFGLWNKKLLMKPVDELFSLLSKKKTKIVWRETAPQHFANDGGTFTPESLLEDCRAIDENFVSRGNAYNRIYNPIVAKHKVFLMRIWNITRPFYFAHAVGECTRGQRVRVKREGKSEGKE